MEIFLKLESDIEFECLRVLSEMFGMLFGEEFVGWRRGETKQIHQD